MRGDRVEVLIDVGDGVRSFEITATKDGRRVEVATVRGNVHVSEVTRSGQEVRTAQFMATRVVAIVEHPAAEEKEVRPRKRRGPPKDQQALGI
jgi:predicted phosphodiesterase